MNSDSDVQRCAWEPDQRRRFGELTARAWCDAALSLRYERDPIAVLGEFGLGIPRDVAPPSISAKPAELSVEALYDTRNLVPLPCEFCFCFQPSASRASEDDGS